MSIVAEDSRIHEVLNTYNQKMDNYNSIPSDLYTTL